MVRHKCNWPGWRFHQERFIEIDSFSSGHSRSDVGGYVNAWCVMA